jgi:hypothetical protein
MYTITGQDHDQGAGAITVFRYGASDLNHTARLMGECGYRRVTTLDVGAITTREHVRTFLADVQRHEPVDWRVLYHCFEVVFGHKPRGMEEHVWVCLDRIRCAVASTAIVGE